MPGKFDRFMVDVHIGSNRKLRRLTVPERWCHVAGVLAVAAQAPIRGRLLVGNDDATVEDYAELSGVSLSVSRSTVEKLRNGGVIVPDEENGCEQVHDFEEMNPAPKTDATNAERQRRYRERRAALRNGGVTAVTEGGVTPGREEKGREERANALSSSERRLAKVEEIDQRFSTFLAKLIVRHNPKMETQVKPDSEKWLTDARLTRERDKRTPAEMEQLARWVFGGSSKGSRFWANVVQSPAGFRDKFASMWGRMEDELADVSRSAVESIDDFQRRRDEAAA